MARLFFAGSLAALALAGLAAIPAQADRKRYNKLDEEGRAVGAAWTGTGRFETLTAAGMDDVRFTQGERWQIRATGDARALKQLRFLVERDSLVVGRISGPRERYGKVQVEVVGPSLRGVTSAGSGAVDVSSMAGPNASATVAGSGRTTVRRVDSERLHATIAGSGELDLTGRSKRTDLTIAGSGKMLGAGFTTDAASVTVAGSGGARFRSPGSVRATFVGSGNVDVTGTTDCKQTRMGSGRLTCRR